MGYRENLVALEARLAVLRRELVHAEQLATDARAIVRDRNVDTPQARLRPSRWIAVVAASAVCALLGAWLFSGTAPTEPAQIAVITRPGVYRAAIQRAMDHQVPCNGCFQVLAWPSRISATGLRSALSVEHELPR